MATRKCASIGCMIHFSLSKRSCPVVTVETSGKWEQVDMSQMGIVTDYAAVSEQALASDVLALIPLYDRRQQADLWWSTSFVDDTSQTRRHRPQENAEEDRPPTRESLMTSIERNLSLRRFLFELEKEIDTGDCAERSLKQLINEHQ